MPDSYIICATPRTGSTLLCDLLAATKIAGNPDSFFMRDVDPVWAKRWGLPERAGRSEAAYAAAFLQAVLKTGKAGTDIFGLRLMRESLEGLASMLDEAHPGLASDRDRLAAAFGDILYIHLTREDKLAQAVSMVKAEQTGLWHIAPDGSELERLAPPQEPAYDFDRIRRKLLELEAYDEAWTAWFDAQGIQPLRIGYERLSEDPAGMLAKICDALSVPPPSPEAVQPGIARLSDEISEEWMTRYRQDSDRNTIPPR